MNWYVRFGRSFSRVILRHSSKAYDLWKSGTMLEKSTMVLFEIGTSWPQYAEDRSGLKRPRNCSIFGTLTPSILRPVTWDIPMQFVNQVRWSAVGW